MKKILIILIISSLLFGFGCVLHPKVKERLKDLVGVELYEKETNK